MVVSQHRNEYRKVVSQHQWDFWEPSIATHVQHPRFLAHLGKLSIALEAALDDILDRLDVMVGHALYLHTAITYRVVGRMGRGRGRCVVTAACSHTQARSGIFFAANKLCALSNAG